MKKLVLLAFCLCSTMAYAQSITVLSAFQDMRKGYLNKAKAEIDAACIHEDTRNDAKTWCYKAQIYCRIGVDALSEKPKYPRLAPDWCITAEDALQKCVQFDYGSDYIKECKEVEIFLKNNCKVVSPSDDASDNKQMLRE